MMPLRTAAEFGAGGVAGALRSAENRNGSRNEPAAIWRRSDDEASQTPTADRSAHLDRNQGACGCPAVGQGPAACFGGQLALASGFAVRRAEFGAGGVAGLAACCQNADGHLSWGQMAIVWLRRLVHGIGLRNPYVSRLGGPDKRGVTWRLHSVSPRLTG